MDSPNTSAAVGVSIFIQVVGAILTVIVTALVGWVYNTSQRVTKLEAERVNLVNLEKIMTAKYDALADLIDLKFEHLHELLQRGLIVHGTQKQKRDVNRDE